MINTIEKYMEQLAKYEEIYDETFEIYHFHRYGLKISELPQWAVLILTSISYNNEEKDKFVTQLLLHCLEDMIFLQRIQGYRVLFLNNKYINIYSEEELEKYLKRRKGKIETYEIANEASLSDGMEIKSVTESVPTFLKKKKFLSKDKYLQTTNRMKYVILQEETFFSSMKDNVEKTSKIVEMNIDTAASITHFNENDRWNEKENIFISDEENDIYDLMNKLKQRVEYVSFTGNAGAVYRRVIFFNEPIFVNIGHVKIPIMEMIIPEVGRTKFVIGMNALSQCELLFYKQRNTLKIKIDKCLENQRSFLTGMYNSEIILGKDPIHTDDVFFHISNFEQNYTEELQVYQVNQPLNLIFVDYINFERIFDYDGDTLKRDGNIFYQDNKDKIKQLLTRFDGIVFENDFRHQDDVLIILRKDIIMEGIQDYYHQKIEEKNCGYGNYIMNLQN